MLVRTGIGRWSCWNLCTSIYIYIYQQVIIYMLMHAYVDEIGTEVLTSTVGMKDETRGRIVQKARVCIQIFTSLFWSNIVFIIYIYR